MSKCPVCGLNLADPPKGGKCDPRFTAAAPAVPAPAETRVITVPEQTYSYHAPGPAWSPNG